jgi:hypothetical protein
LFKDYVFYLIEEIQKQIHANTSADYECGIAGIGVGIDYLTRHSFLNVADDIFDDFDQRMYRAVMYDLWTDFSLYDGLVGYGRFWIARQRARFISGRAQECLLHITGLIEENLSNISVQELTDVYCFLYDAQKAFTLAINPNLMEKCRKRLSSIEGDQYFLRLGSSFVGNITRMYQYNHYFSDTSSGKVDVALQQMGDLDLDEPLVDMGIHSGYARGNDAIDDA